MPRNFVLQTLSISWPLITIGFNEFIIVARGAHIMKWGLLTFNDSLLALSPSYPVELGVDIVNKFVKVFPRVKHIGITSL